MNKAFLSLLLSILIITAVSCSKQQPSSQTPTPTSRDLDLGPMSPTVLITSTPAPQVQAPLPTETPEPPEYVLEKIKGTVQIKSGEENPEDAEEEQTVESGDEIITKDGSEVSLTLDENTMFHLGPNSDVKVSRLVWNDSNGFISRIELLGGKILSEVEKLQDTNSTFEVESGGVVCGVRGTAFEVEQQGGAVHMSTFHGTVEMKKGALVQRVNANEHGAFSLHKSAFLPKRNLRPMERNHYQTWLRQKTVVQQRYQQRQTLLRSMNKMSPEEKSRLLQKTRGMKPRDRMRAMHQELQRKTNTQGGSREKGSLMEKSSQQRPHPLQKRQNRAFQNQRKNPGLRMDRQTGQKQNSQNPQRPLQKIQQKQQGQNRPNFQKPQKPLQRIQQRQQGQNRPTFMSKPNQNQNQPKRTMNQPPKTAPVLKNKPQPKGKPVQDKKKKKDKDWKK